MNDHAYPHPAEFGNAEPEVLVPVTCPVCSRESMVGFRYSVITNAFATGSIRLYVDCHVAGWEGSHLELAAIRDYLDTVWGTGLQGACEEFFTLDQFLDSDSLSFIYTGVLGSQAMGKRPDSPVLGKASAVRQQFDDTLSMSFSRRADRLPHYWHAPAVTGLTHPIL